MTKKKEPKPAESIVQHKFQEGYASFDLRGDLESYDPILKLISTGEWYATGDTVRRKVPFKGGPGFEHYSIGTFYGGTNQKRDHANAKLAAAARKLLVALRHCERAMNAQVQMCHDRDSHFTDPKVHSRPADYQAMVAEMYAQTGEPLAHARKLLKELNEKIP